VALFKNTNVSTPLSPKTIRLATVDSTNNYAMRQIDAASAAHGDLVLADRQEAGKGQRGKTWLDSPGECLLMSLILAPGMALSEQPVFLAAVALGVLDTIRALLPAGVPCSIKWPNDILIADKKAVGILIENVVRGSQWQWAVVGIGANLGQQSFPNSLPNATSLHLQGAALPSPEELASEISRSVLARTAQLAQQGAALIWEAYNRNLYKRGELQSFRYGYDQIVRRVLDVDENGYLRVRNLDGDIQHFNHGNAEWIWG
jgi:BirA family biotin operon repressor/biotin-[acetyl-CoA-carboxylase] ligase